MKCCSKCKGENFIKVANSTVVPTLTFYLCRCGNVMMKEAILGDILLPTPENGPLAKFMMEDASKAFGIPMSLGYLKEEDRPQAASKFAEMLQEYFSSLSDDEDEDVSDYPAGECDYECDEYDCYCDDCGECEEYCYCDDEEEDDYAEELDEVVHFLDMIVQFADTDPEFLEIWNDLRNSGELVDLVEDILDENGLDVSDLLAQKNELVKMVPTPFQEDELLAKVISVFASKDIQRATDKARREKANKLTADCLEGEISLDKLVKAARKIAQETEKEPVVAGPQSLLEKLAAMKVTGAIKESMDAPDVKLGNKHCSTIEQVLAKISTERTATYNDEIKEDEEETKSYVVLNKDGSWKLYEDMTKEEMSDALNEDDAIEDFMIYEIKNVNMAGRVVFSIKE